MSDGYGLVYSKVERMVPGNRGVVDGGNFYFSSNTLEKTVGTAPHSVLITNTGAAGVSFNAYYFGSQSAGITNYILFSENVRAGITTGVQGWNIYNQDASGFPQHPANRYSPIRMPDGSTNGVRLITRAGIDSGGIYQPFPSTSVLERGKMYTFSCWIAGDSGGGVYPETSTARLSYYNNTTGASVFTEDLTVTPVPTRHSYTFIAMENATQTQENVAIGNGLSTKGITAQFVLWGAQLNEGNTAGPYIPTSTEWNGRGSGSVGATSVVYQAINNPDIRDIERVSLTAKGNSSFILTNSFFAFSTNNASVASSPPISVYGLY